MLKISGSVAPRRGVKLAENELCRNGSCIVDEERCFSCDCSENGDSYCKNCERYMPCEECAEYETDGE